MGKVFSFLCEMTSALSFGFGIVVALNRHRAPKRSYIWLWAGFCFAVAFWSLGLGMMTRSASPETATYWLDVHYFGAILIPTLFLHFILSFLQIAEKKSTLILFCYLATFV